MNMAAWPPRKGREKTPPCKGREKTMCRRNDKQFSLEVQFALRAISTQDMIFFSSPF